MKIKWITILASMLTLFIGCASQRTTINDNCYEVLYYNISLYQDYNYFKIKSLKNNDTLNVVSKKTAKSSENLIEIEEGLQLDLQLQPCSIKTLKININRFRSSHSTEMSTFFDNIQITEQDTVVAKLYIADEIKDRFIDPKNVGCK